MMQLQSVANSEKKKNCSHNIHVNTGGHVGKSDVHTIIIRDCWIRNTVVCMKTRRVSLATIADSVFEESLVMVNQYCIHLLRKPMRTDFLLC